MVFRRPATGGGRPREPMMEAAGIEPAKRFPRPLVRVVRAARARRSEVPASPTQLVRPTPIGSTVPKLAMRYGVDVLSAEAHDEYVRESAGAGLGERDPFAVG